MQQLTGEDIASLFEQPPTQWGLRGDPGLWRDMQEQSLKLLSPIDAGQLEKTLLGLFKDLVGR